jgi:hypothetical protein
MDGIKIRKIAWHPKTRKLNQIAKEGLEFALVSDKYEQIHQLVWCKDFLQDVYHGFLNNSISEIYGFKYDPAECCAVSLDRTRMIVTNWKDKELGDKLKKGVLPLLHEVEDALKMSKTIMEKCGSVPPRYGRSGVWLLDSSKRWFKAPPMISLYTLLIRVGLVKEEGDSLETTIEKIKNGTVKCYYSEQKEQDKHQLKRAEKGIKEILKHGDRRLFYPDPKLNYPPVQNGKKDISIYTIHDHCGIVAYSEGYTKSNFPYWHRLEGKNK